MYPIAVWLLSFLLCAPVLAAEPPEPGLMLRAGNWMGDIGTYTVPPGLARLKPSQWPNQGWHRLSIGKQGIELSAVAGSSRQRPVFLATIAAQVLAGQAAEPTASAAAAAVAQAQASASDDKFLYLRLPGLELRSGAIEFYRFNNGTAALAPKLDHRYELRLGQQAFAFTVRNGLKGRQGASYGEGAQYNVEYDGNSYEYSLPEYGWDSRVSAIADIDGDGKPDFLISVGGNNSAHEYLLLSSQARPGKNPPSASLHATGC